MQGDQAEPRGWVRLPALFLVLAISIAILACGITDPLEASWQRLDEALSHADGIEQLAEGEQLDKYRDAVQRGRRMRELQDVTAEQVDAMTREIEEARKLAEDVEVIYGWNKPLPSYDDLVANADRYRDKKFLLGRVVSRVEDAREWGLGVDGMYVHMALTPGKEDAEPIVLRVAMTVHEPGDLCMFIGSYSYPAYYPSGEHFPCFWLEDSLRREEYDEWVRTATVPVDYSPDRARLSSLIGSYQEDEERFLRDEGWDRYSAAVDGHRHLLEEVDASEQELRSAADELEELRSQLKTRVYGEGLPMPAYSEVTTNLEDYKGCLFLVSGRVTRVHDTNPLIKKTRENPKGGDYDPIEVYVFWDEGERVGEVAHVEIRRAHYRTQVRERGRFTATCVLTGVDERGHPVLTCTSYSYKR